MSTSMSRAVPAWLTTLQIASRGDLLYNGAEPAATFIPHGQELSFESDRSRVG